MIEWGVFEVEILCRQRYYCNTSYILVPYKLDSVKVNSHCCWRFIDCWNLWPCRCYWSQKNKWWTCVKEPLWIIILQHSPPYLGHFTTGQSSLLSLEALLIFLCSNSHFFYSISWQAWLRSVWFSTFLVIYHTLIQKSYLGIIHLNLSLKLTVGTKSIQFNSCFVLKPNIQACSIHEQPITYDTAINLHNNHIRTQDTVRDRSC